jgi:hypothetical protein
MRQIAISVTNHLSPVCGCGVYLIRYATMSHICGLEDVKSPIKRSVALPSSNLPLRISSNKRNDSSTGRVRHGDGTLVLRSSAICYSFVCLFVRAFRDRNRERWRAELVTSYANAKTGRERNHIHLWSDDRHKRVSS